MHLHRHRHRRSRTSGICCANTFGKIIPPDDNKFAALELGGLVGWFVHLRAAKGVKIEFPLQAYFRINAENMGQFERTLIIVDEGAQVHYVEGCTAPMYTSETLALGRGRSRSSRRTPAAATRRFRTGPTTFTTSSPSERWPTRTRRWNGSMATSAVELTMKYPAVYMMEPGARGEILSIAFSSEGQHQDAGAKLVHCAPNTTGQIISKSISKNGGRSSYRGLVRVEKGADNSKCNVVCDALILDPESRSDTYPYIEIDEQDVSIGHEASVSRIGEEQLFYLMSRGLSRSRSQHDDRQRIHRAAGQRTADGIRRRNEPPDPTADGRLGGLVVASSRHCALR